MARAPRQHQACRESTLHGETQRKILPSHDDVSPGFCPDDWPVLAAIGTIPLTLTTPKSVSTNVISGKSTLAFLNLPDIIKVVGVAILSAPAHFISFLFSFRSLPCAIDVADLR